MGCVHRLLREGFWHGRYFESLELQDPQNTELKAPEDHLLSLTVKPRALIDSVLSL